MRRRLFWIVMLVVAFALIFLIRNSDSTDGLSNTDVGYGIYYGLLALVVGASVLALYGRKLARAFNAALIWLVIALSLIVAYTYRNEMSEVYERVMAELMPGRTFNRGTNVVEIVRGRNGDFQVRTQINGVRIPMVLDTGASAVVLTQEAAKAAGLPIEVLTYDVNVDTANGRTKAASVTLDSVAVGSIVERAVPALIAQPGQLRTSLLGMNFLKRLESWEMRGDKVVMRGYP
ncbi:MAG TPA: TIGR02281 family clan AA aspartic protease [Xanthobacteraceae bacterium]|nr:TIGR02281 family clan AA aspartic protease [Xanthobacteraceae bacterium]